MGLLHRGTTDNQATLVFVVDGGSPVHGCLAASLTSTRCLKCLLPFQLWQPTMSSDNHIFPLFRGKLLLVENCCPRSHHQYRCPLHSLIWGSLPSDWPPLIFPEHFLQNPAFTESFSHIKTHNPSVLQPFYSLIHSASLPGQLITDRKSTRSHWLGFPLNPWPLTSNKTLDGAKQSSHIPLSVKDPLS